MTWGISRRRSRRAYSACCAALAALALSLGAARSSAEARPSLAGDGGITLHPRIVNGSVTNQYPAVGVLLQRESAGGLSMLCSATLIGCKTVVTAAHCFCPPDRITGQTPPCDDIEALNANFTGVFFQHAGLFTPATIVLNPDYEFGYRGDVAIITLAEPVTGIAPMRFNTARLPSSGTSGVIVGFGRTGGDPRSNYDYGIKRRAGVETAICPDPVAGNPHLCFSLALPNDAGTCNGDSGGPLFMDFGNGDVLAGITSGGFAYGNCQAPAFNFSTNVFTEREWISSQLAADVSQDCSGLPEAGEAGTTVLGTTNLPDAEDTQQRFRFDIPADTGLVRLALNGEDFAVNGTTPFTQGFRLYARMNAEPTAADPTCGGDHVDPYKFCEIVNPGSGTLHVLLERVVGFARYQMTVTLFSGAGHVTPRISPTPTPTRGGTPTPRPTKPLGPCFGDCDDDGRIAISELVRGVTLALAGTVATECTRLDDNADGRVSVNELVLAVGAALNGCVPR